MPFLGMLSDRMTGSLGQRFGRRRPFIVMGQLLNSAGLVVLAFATSIETLTLGYMMLFMGNILTWVPCAFNCLPPVELPTRNSVNCLPPVELP